MTRKSFLSLAGQGLGEESLSAYVAPTLDGREWAQGLLWEKLSDSAARAEIKLPQSWIEAATHLIPCFSSSTKGNYAYQFGVQLTSGGTVPLSTVGDYSTGMLKSYFDPSPEQSTAFRADIDLYHVEDGSLFEKLVLIASFEKEADFFKAPHLLSCAVTQQTRNQVIAPTNQSTKILPVPALSQMELHESVAARACSPTCIAMVLQYYKLDATAELTTALTYNVEHDIYGQWPLSILAASKWGLLGYITKFTSWDPVMWCIEQNLPLIASIRYQEGELEGAAVEKSPGHLVVIRGIRDNKVLVNDPGAASASEVAREYDIKQFNDLWFNTGHAGDGLAYVLLPRFS